jgi:DNA polymerase I-like protein with 3'-5' exonuclease and polymerase domains
MPKGLQHVMSFLTEEPYHKDEGKEFDPKKDDITKLFLYNATDCTTEYETMERILEMLESAGLSDAFWRMAQPQYAMYSDMEDVGIKLDTETQAKLHAKYTVFRTEKKKQLVATIQGEDLGALRVRGKSKGQVVIKSIDVANINCNSPQQISALLYGYLGLPARRDVGEATLKALANNVAKKPSHKAIIKMILEDRKIGKTIGTYLEAEAGTYPVNLWTPFQGTERIFTQYNINGTSSGRTSTSICKPPVALRDQGLALQTMTKHGDETLDVGGADLRAMFIADEGWTIVEADLAGAEDRVVAVLAKDWDALRLLEKTEFRYNEHGLKDDRHTLTGMMVTGKDFFAMTDYDRQIGKRTRHAGNYLMQKHQGMITFAKYGLYLPEAVVGVMLDRFHAANPNIKNVFHEDIKYALEFNNRTLVSPFGRREVFFEQWGEDLWKKAFSFIPQATVSESVRLAMLRILKRADRKHFHFIMEAHDSCVSLVRDEYVNYYCKIVREEMSRPIDFNKCTLSRDYQLVIPTDIKIGKRWVEASVEYPDGMQKWKG